MSIFNFNNQEWKTGTYSLFLGEDPGLYDSINKPYPQIFRQYKLQKSIDWAEDEVNLEQSRLDLVNCSKNNYDIMLKNLAYQWELDSVAARSITPLLAPFVTNSELWAWYSKCAEMEVLHALTYSEIIRQCIPNPQDALKEAVENVNVVNRATKVVEVFTSVEKVGCKLKLGMLEKTSTEVRNAILLAVVALYCLERIEFMSSFAATFCLGEQGIFQGICKLVQKIAQDEVVHFKTGEEVIKILQNSGWKDDIERNKIKIKQIIYEIYEQEISWNKYLFSEGRKIIGLNKELLDLWVQYNAQVAYKLLDIVPPFGFVKDNPIPWIDNWLEINKSQNANQECDNINYTLNTVINDLDDNQVLEYNNGAENK